MYNQKDLAPAADMATVSKERGNVMLNLIGSEITATYNEKLLT